MTLHITYNDGSNPFFILNGSKKQIKRELNFQWKHNASIIDSILIIDGNLNKFRNETANKALA